MQQGSAKKILSNLLKVAISVGGLAYIFWKVPFAEVCKHWTAQALPWILLILFCTVFSMAIQANRWRSLLLEEGKKIKLRTFYAYIALGYFFNNLLPSGFGGDAVKTIAFGKRFGNIANSVAAVAISRVMGLLAMFLCFFATLPFVVARYDIPTIYTGAVSAVALVSVLVIVGGLFSDKIKLPAKLTAKVPFLLKLQDAFSIYRGYKKSFLLSGLDSIWLQISSIAIHYAYFQAVGVPVDLATITVFMTITITVSMLPISINGIGIREGVNVSLFTGLLGIPADIVLAAALIGYIPMLFQAAQGAFVFAIIGKRNSAQ
ncbi:MAG: flippase-like domain-containing protein [Fibrobacter sp.]|uniref:lysylphosphatidylglycerol synthase transmembrane domain-containing protein n=1 Tax=Fibrobacter sp. TaxID=35828 RepID=UPI001B052ED5|nr:lysylphosphatidylglycerol synthase transmembrane domain-containing protein [Fibrobacter sp.]MBO7059892.1 flippase-like domain-containing protein [Fibrobacter sp.]